MITLKGTKHSQSNQISGMHLHKYIKLRKIIHLKHPFHLKKSLNPQINNKNQFSAFTTSIQLFYFKDNTNTLVRIYMHYTYIIYYIDSVYTYVVFVQIDKYIYMGVCTCTDTHRCTLSHLYYYCLILVLSWIRVGWVWLVSFASNMFIMPIGLTIPHYGCPCLSMSQSH